MKIESNEVVKFSCEVDGGSRGVDRGRSFITVRISRIHVETFLNIYPN